MGDKDFLVARDWQSVLNTGAVFIRNSEFSRTLLQAVWDNDHPFRAEIHEQASLADIYTRNHLDSQSHIIILPHYRQNEFLTYWYSYFPDQCFIVHATRCADDRLGFIFTMDMFCTVKMEEESDAQYQDRLDWLATNRSRVDIDHYLSGGERRNFSARYQHELQKQNK
jgi:hypothetical protein